jgi:hypothetical protein
MGWPLRMFEEEGYYFVTSRCFQGRLLLRPSAEVNDVVGGVLAKAVQQSPKKVSDDSWGVRCQCEVSERIR